MKVFGKNNTLTADRGGGLRVSIEWHQGSHLSSGKHVLAQQEIHTSTIAIYLAGRMRRIISLAHDALFSVRVPMKDEMVVSGWDPRTCWW